MKITSPVEGFTGRTNVGSTVLDFENGTATVDGDLPPGVIGYLQQAGYGIDGKTRSTSDEPARPDSRQVTVEQVGAPLRDAAVDPQPGDFLAPTNAGQADPHGPTVVSPEVHASQGVRPVKPGDVHVDDPAEQDQAEKAHADHGRGNDDGEPAPGDLKGAELDDALSKAGLAKTGTADEKRARLAEHLAQA